MADPYPLYPEVEPAAANAPYCGSSAVGCTVCSTASIITRYKRVRITDLKALGRSMGARHRRADSRVRHGICPNAWCHYCMYLELKARGIPVAYGNLTWAKIVAQVKAGHPVGIPYKYGVLRRVSPNSFSRTTPAKGRVDSFTGSHSSVLWAISGTNFIVSDPDFGMSWAPVPPHSLIPIATMKRAWEVYRWGVCYTTQKPPKLTTVPSGVDLQTQWGATLTNRGTYAGKVKANIRRSPFIRSTNVVDSLSVGEKFVCAQSTRAGTNVGGSSLWLGNARGDRWVHSSVVKAV
jgi:hypothetical protein